MKKISLIKKTRYYLMSLEKTLFDEWEVIRLYGNINYKSHTGIRKNYFDSFDNAYQLISKKTQEKIKKGYCQI